MSEETPTTTPEVEEDIEVQSLDSDYDVIHGKETQDKDADESTEGK